MAVVEGKYLWHIYNMYALMRVMHITEGVLWWYDQST